MNKIDYKYICQVIGDLTGIPVRYYENNNLVYYHSFVNLIKDPILLCESEVFKIKEHVGYYVSDDFFYYGIVQNDKIKIVIGPSFEVISNSQLKHLSFLLGVEQNDTDEFITSMKAIIRMPIESIVEVLIVVNYILNDEKKSIKEITILDSSQAAIEDDRTNNEIEKQMNYVDDIDKVETHNTMSIEHTILNIIRRGDSSALLEWTKKAPAVKAGTIAFNQLRQQKNLFIVSTTLASRAAISGGMDSDDALALSDSYIQRCENLNTPEAITNLQYFMISDYTKRVEKLHLGKNPSKLVIDVSNYIQKHISDNIKVENIADALYLSRSRLSTKFKNETGQTLISYIEEKKIEEAKKLLKYSTRSLTEISYFLNFSSPSHFTNTFKKVTSVTPIEYRNKNLIE